MTDGTGQFVYPLVAFAITLLIAGALRRRWDDIRIGLAAWRERPVVLSLGALAWAVAPSGCVLLALLLRDWAADVPTGRHLSRWLLADRPFALFTGSLVAVMTLFLMAAGPWLTDHLSRVLRYQRRFRRLQRQREQDALSREVLKLGEEIAERPYREQVLVGLLLRIGAGRPHSELWESVLRTLARVPRLGEPGWLFRLTPLWAAEVKMRLLFADALVSEYNRTQARPHLDAALLVLEGLHHRPPVLAGREARAAIALTLAWALGLRHTRNPAADAGDLDRALTLAEQAAAVLPAETAGGVTGRLLSKQYERQADAATLDRAIDTLRSAGPSFALIWVLVLRYRATGSGNDLAEANATALTRRILSRPLLSCLGLVSLPPNQALQVHPLLAALRREDDMRPGGRPANAATLGYELGAIGAPAPSRATRRGRHDLRDRRRSVRQLATGRSARSSRGARKSRSTKARAVASSEQRKLSWIGVMRGRERRRADAGLGQCSLWGRCRRSATGDPDGASRHRVGDARVTRGWSVQAQVRRGSGSHDQSVRPDRRACA
ncbi:hypothetical protein [Streptomyces xinghaiensis]|uniref:hypothetical protein n=1 Tax=Streptomyces xinghaiensis TaxID=1038928 RepID=UPI003436AB74